MQNGDSLTKLLVIPIENTSTKCFTKLAVHSPKAYLHCVDQRLCLMTRISNYISNVLSSGGLQNICITVHMLYIYLYPHSGSQTWGSLTSPSSKQLASDSVLSAATLHFSPQNVIN